ncbi:DUF2969 family protein [Leuconostoc mesenteroides]|jgi:hypothetical protein|uniref:DUF2969 family protein n=3 Tax=Leuconostoc mesenteroides TaxID=1245 RepID=A0A843Z0P3_LEUME|nr:DUF2969 family protein [Leuconostoc mesenteroides]EQC82755.1 hypothetical protein LMT8_01185 [Leuconostoc mesenteroides subsp. cremoris TIFN8]KDA52675.1 hypothetical protein L963_674 [Leuconostoc mesenteroides subsp. cremoris T26]ABJ61388.1 hypothetical protein LEUM_0261 [Leuconostoc mesenteroides subsp. mesenteroides ATCC 8293]AET29673.1 hypothetical protein MI1_01055 [Leuconostoc mesenteroides subsp. mesenteroides J18]AQU48681.1 hypothetical protein ARA01_01220 [Leuconostoc mesenteroides 
MRRKNQNFDVELIVNDQQTQVLVDKKQIGYIEKADRGFVGFFGQQAIINQAKDEAEALQAILASFNLNH